jgi:hypothetical protein
MPDVGASVRIGESGSYEYTAFFLHGRQYRLYLPFFPDFS